MDVGKLEMAVRDAVQEGSAVTALDSLATTSRQQVPAEFHDAARSLARRTRRQAGATSLVMAVTTAWM